jgi:GntR family transcriptional regulator
MKLPVRIDKTSHTPIYVQVSEQIRTLINSGQIKVNDRLPSETYLAEKLELSPMTIRQALQQLVHEGILHRERGKGTFVSQRPVVHQLERLTSFTEDMQDRGINPKTAIIEFDYREMPDEVREYLGLAVQEKACFIKRLRLADGLPAGVHEAYLSPIVGITREELEDNGSLYSLMESRGYMITGGSETLEACGASQDIAELLQIEPGSPVLRVIRTTHDRKQQNIEYVIAHYRGDLYKYYVSLSR